MHRLEKMYDGKQSQINNSSHCVVPPLEIISTEAEM